MTGEKLILNIEGMDCADCARTIEKGVSRLKGVETCQVKSHHPTDDGSRETGFKRNY